LNRSILLVGFIRNPGTSAMSKSAVNANQSLDSLRMLPHWPLRVLFNSNQFNSIHRSFIDQLLSGYCLLDIVRTNAVGWLLIAHLCGGAS